MGTCSKCGKPDIGDTGFCFKHGGRVQATPVRNAIFSLENADQTYATAQSADQAKTWLQDKCDQAQYSNAPAVVAAMQDGPDGARTKKSVQTSIGVVYHASQGAAGKAGSLTAFWVEATPGTVTIVAVGAHQGSDSYKISWTGKTWKWGTFTAAGAIK